MPLRREIVHGYRSRRLSDDLVVIHAQIYQSIGTAQFKISKKYKRVFFYGTRTVERRTRDVMPQAMLKRAENVGNGVATKEARWKQERGRTSRKTVLVWRTFSGMRCSLLPICLVQGLDYSR